MASTTPETYVLGSTDAEHLRLVRQARLLEPLTERLFRDAGIGEGMRVLDLGCGMGDVSMLAARLAGPSGRVIGVDRDDKVLAKARQRAEAAGFENIRFVQSDVADLPSTEPFDAAVGRFILMFLPDPVAVLKTLCALVRSGGVVAFQEASWANMLAQHAHLPLRREAAALCHQALARSGARTNNELFLYRDFQAAGLPPPTLLNELQLGDAPEIRRYLVDLLTTLWPRAGEFGLSRDKVGDLSTLAKRLDAELDANNSFATSLGVVGAFSRRP
jgi:ubiquinone/menaquinone biosynthesis C-methylase UbiE